MYIIENSIKNIGRNKGRNILLGIIIFTLILITTIALTINTTTKGIISDYKNRFGSKVTLTVDFDKLMSETKPNSNGIVEFPTAPEISSEKYLAFAKSKYLKNYQVDMSTGIVFDKLKAVAEDKNNNGMMGSVGNSKENVDYISPKAKILGYSAPNNLPDFDNGLRKIIEGTMYKEKNDCLISSDFADLNKLKVGDTIDIMDTNKKKAALKVVGIYGDATKATKDLPAGAMSLEGSYGNRRNEIFVNLATMRDNFDVNKLAINAEYSLKSPRLVKKFEEELRAKGLPTEYSVETDEAGYNKIVAPVVGMSEISMSFMWTILFVGGIVLVFVTSMVIRERKYEIGVLRTMGMKKTRIAVMLVIEMLFITSLCLGIGLGTGSLLSQPVADTLIAKQVETIDKKEPQPNFSNGSISIENAEESSVEALTEIDVSLNKETIIQIFLIAFALALLSSIVGVVAITKYEPMKILAERN